jgi:hypothetical protein
MTYPTDPVPTSTRAILHKVNELFPLLNERGIIASPAEQTWIAEQVGERLNQLHAYFKARSERYCFVTPANVLAFILGQRDDLLIHFSTKEVGQLLLNELVDGLNLKASWQSVHRFVVVKSC